MTALRPRCLAVVAFAATLAGCAAPRTIPTYLNNIYEGLRGTAYRSAPPFGAVGAEALPVLQQYNAEHEGAVNEYLTAHADAMDKIPPAATEAAAPQ